MLLKDVMTPVNITLKKESTLGQAVELMNQYKWNVVPVTDGGGRLIGVFTRSSLFEMILNRYSVETSIESHVIKEVVTLPLETSFSKVEEIVKKSEVGTGVVINKENKPVGLFTKTDMIFSLFQETYSLKAVNTLKKQLETIIKHAYDGIVMTDEEGTITMANPPLCDLFSLTYEEAIKKHVDEVFPQLKLSSVFESRTIEVSDFMEMKGIKFMVNRIPIIEEGEVIGAIGKVMFRRIHEVRQVFKKLEAKESQVKGYKNQPERLDTSRYTWDQIISADNNIERIKQSAKKAAKGLSTVLIRGESGTGKELFAHAIHSSSTRKGKPFVTVNCAAIPEQLLESEFFGYEEGAFTGARSKGKAGKFDLANGGTLFLDEIGDMSLPLQAKMLRVLQEKEFYRVGGTKRVHVDVRIIAATNQRLEQLVSEGRFREDLYYRLNVISFQIPPLRERSQDIPLLCEYFMEELNRTLGTSITSIDKEALAYLMNFDWPGNIRELRNVMERAMTFAEHGKIRREDLPEYMVQQAQQHSFPSHIHSTPLLVHAEKQAIESALSTAKGNKTKAASLLGISRSSLYEKMKKLQVT
ncbi:MAG TPA: sigma 54-interacting transcriptional regulator [Chondromyces sp.]|nr:sigma 54-interacting transcriptional regulator [Chondromyces sp.]